MPDDFEIKRRLKELYDPGETDITQRVPMERRREINTQAVAQQQFYREKTGNDLPIDPDADVLKEAFAAPPPKNRAGRSGYLFDEDNAESLARRMAKRAKTPAEQQRFLRLVREATEEQHEAVTKRLSAPLEKSERTRAWLAAPEGYDKNAAGAAASFASVAFENARRLPFAREAIGEMLTPEQLSEAGRARKPVAELSENWLPARAAGIAGSLTAELPAFSASWLKALSGAKKLAGIGATLQMMHGEGTMLERAKGVPLAAGAFLAGGGLGAAGEKFLVAPLAQKLVKRGMPGWLSRAVADVGPALTHGAGFTAVGPVEAYLSGHEYRWDRIHENLLVNTAMMYAMRAAHRMDPGARAETRFMREQMGRAFKGEAPGRFDRKRLELLAAKLPPVEVELAYRAALKGQILSPEEISRALRDPSLLPGMLAEMGAVPKTFVQVPALGNASVPREVAGSAQPLDAQGLPVVGVVHLDAHGRPTGGAGAGDKDAPTAVDVGVGASGGPQAGLQGQVPMPGSVEPHVGGVAGQAVGLPGPAVGEPALGAIHGSTETQGTDIPRGIEMAQVFQGTRNGPWATEYMTGEPSAYPWTGAGGVNVSRNPTYALKTTAGGERPSLNVGEMRADLRLVDGAREAPPDLLQPLTDLFAQAGINAETMLRSQPLGEIVPELIQAVTKVSRPRTARPEEEGDQLSLVPNEKLGPEQFKAVLDLGNAIRGIVMGAGYDGITRFGGLESSDNIWIADARQVRFKGGQEIDPETGLPKPVAPEEPVGPEAPPEVVERPETPGEVAKTQEEVSAEVGVEKMARRLASEAEMEAWVEEAAPALDAKGVTPGALIDRFFGEAWGNLDPAKQGRLEKMLERASGMKVGDFKFASGDEAKIADVRDLAKFATGDFGTFESMGAEPSAKPYLTIMRLMGSLLPKSAEKVAPQRAPAPPGATEHPAPRRRPSEAVGQTPYENLPRAERALVDELKDSYEVAERVSQIEDAREAAAIPREETLPAVARGIIERYEKGGKKPVFNREAAAKMLGWKDSARRKFPKKDPRDLTPAQRRAVQNAVLKEHGIAPALVGDTKTGYGLDEPHLLGGGPERGTEAEDVSLEALKAASVTTPKGEVVPRTLKRMRAEDARAAKEAGKPVDVVALAKDRLSEMYRDLEDWSAEGSGKPPPHPEILDRWRAYDALLGFAPQGSPADIAFASPEASDPVFDEHLRKGTAQRPEGPEESDDPSHGERGFIDAEMIGKVLLAPYRVARWLLKDEFTPWSELDARGMPHFKPPKRGPGDRWYDRAWNSTQLAQRLALQHMGLLGSEWNERSGSAHFRKQRRFAMDATRFRNAWVDWDSLFRRADRGTQEEMLQRLDSLRLDPKAVPEGATAAEKLFFKMLTDALPRQRAVIDRLAERGARGEVSHLAIDPKAVKWLPRPDIGDLLGSLTGKPGLMLRDLALPYMFEFAGFGGRKRPHPALREPGALVDYAREHSPRIAADFVQELTVAYLQKYAQIVAFEPLKWWWKNDPRATALRDAKGSTWQWFQNNIEVQSGASPKWEQKLSQYVKQSVSAVGDVIHADAVRTMIRNNPAAIAARKKIGEWAPDAVKSWWWRRGGMGGDLLRGWTYANYLGAMGMNPASAIRNLSQHLASMAFLGGPVEGQKWWVKGALKINTDLGRRVLKEIGVTEESFIKSIRQDARTLAQAANVSFGARGAKALMSMFSMSEWSNRAVMGMAAYLKALEMKPGTTHEDALRYAKEAVHSTQFDYRRGLAGTLYAGPFGHAMFQFGRFGFYQMGMLSDLFRRGATGQYSSMGYHKGWGPLLNYIGSTVGMLAAFTAAGVSMEESYGPGAAIPPTIKVGATLALEQGSDLIGGTGSDLGDRERGRGWAHFFGTYPYGYKGESGFWSKMGQAADPRPILGPVPEQAFSALRLAGSGFDQENFERFLKEWTLAVPGGLQAKRIGRMTGVPSWAERLPLPILNELTAEGELETGLARSGRGSAALHLTETDALLRAAGLTSLGVADQYRDLEKARNRESFQQDTVTEINRRVRGMIVKGATLGEARTYYNGKLDEIEAEMGSRIQRKRDRESLFRELVRRATQERATTELDRLQRTRR